MRLSMSIAAACKSLSLGRKLDESQANEKHALQDQSYMGAGGQSWWPWLPCLVTMRQSGWHWLGSLSATAWAVPGFRLVTVHLRWFALTASWFQALRFCFLSSWRSGSESHFSSSWAILDNGEGGRLGSLPPYQDTLAFIIRSRIGLQSWGDKTRIALLKLSKLHSVCASQALIMLRLILWGYSKGDWEGLQRTFCPLVHTDYSVWFCLSPLHIQAFNISLLLPATKRRFGTS